MPVPKRILELIAVVGLLSCSGLAQGEVVIETVPVGNPGNAGELSGWGAGGWGEDRICGAVDYVYSIGKFEVTAGQYTDFLNAVAGDDTYGLYNEAMWTDEKGCKIERTGASPGYSYAVGPEWADRPVNYVSWGDAARFANWLHNGQPVGAQNLTTTEDGSYFLDGATGDAGLMLVEREPDATWVIPSEDEWYKAAYHYNDGPTGNYYDYPTSSDSVPSNDLIDPDPGNNANFYGLGYTIGSPYYRTVVGDFENSESPYNTFDQGGNVYEWNDAVMQHAGGSRRGMRGGYFENDDDPVDSIDLLASFRDAVNLPSSQFNSVGFRVATVSEEASIPTVSQWGLVAMTFLVLTAGTLVFMRRRTAK